MGGDQLKADLHGYLQGAREALVWKLDGLGEHDVRRPLTPTGTNLLGLVRHNAATHLRYFGVVFGRPHGLVLPWETADAGPGAEHWATPEETRADVVALHRRACAHADAVVDELRIDAVGHVPWWGGEPVTLHHVLVHVTAETQRHAGHADILREQLDGAAGLFPGHDNLTAPDPAARRAHHSRVAEAATEAARRYR